MKTSIKVGLIVSLFSVNAFSTTIDYRHEFKDTTKADHKDRISFSNRFNNGFGLSAEVRWGQHSKNTTPNSPLSDSVSNGTEVVASYFYKFNPSFTLESGLSIDSSSDYNNYRPYVRAGFNLTDNLSTTLRYRPYYKRISKNIGTEDHTKETGYNITSVFTYKFDNGVSVDYELDYQKSTTDGVELYNNKDHNISHDIKVAYKFNKNWKPYVQLGNVAESTTSDNRQTRYRVGVQYSF